MSRILEISKKVKARFPWLWDGVEFFNGMWIRMLYGRKIRQAMSGIDCSEKFVYRKLDVADLDEIVRFVESQPTGFDRFFKPHSFDRRTYERLLKSGTYLFVGVFDGEKMVAYCFMRLYANKSAFRGYIVDAGYQGKGISKQMGICMTRIADFIGFRSYATISKDNIPSLQSQKAGAEVRVIRELPDNYLYVEIKNSSNIVLGG